MAGKHFTSSDFFTNYKKTRYFTLLQNAADYFILKCEKYLLQNAIRVYYKLCSVFYCKM